MSGLAGALVAQIVAFYIPEIGSDSLGSTHLNQKPLEPHYYPMKNHSPSSHFLAGHYTTHQPDGVHIEARCTCGVKFEGIGQDESAAMDALWMKFLNHRKDNT